MSGVTKDPKIRRAVWAAHTALVRAYDLIESTELACGFEDVLDAWDPFLEQFGEFDANDE